jgi:hypothetical protein
MPELFELLFKMLIEPAFSQPPENPIRDNGAAPAYREQAGY